MGNRSSIETVGNAITGQNVGSGACVFKGKSTGTNLQFKTILSTGSSIQIIETADQIYISGKTDTGGGGEVTGATNGLNINSGKQVGLGGTLTGDTCIVIANGLCLNVSGGTLSEINVGLHSTTNSFYVSQLFLQCEYASLSVNDELTLCLSGSIYTTPQYSVVANQNLCDNSATQFYICSTAACLNSNRGADNTLMVMTPSALTITGTFAAFAGIQYDSDYSANFTDRSLVDKGYVDNAFSLSGATATNGLNKNSGSAIGLGGTLTGDTFIDIGGNSFTICNSATVPIFTINETLDSIDITTAGGSSVCVCGTACSVIACAAAGAGLDLQGGGIDSAALTTTGGATVSLDGICDEINIQANTGAQVFIQGVSDIITLGTTAGAYICADGAGDVVDLSTVNGGKMTLNSTCNTFTDVNNKGLEYAGDYRANFTDCSLVSKLYVDNAILTGKTFGNGLCEVSGAVCLGGALTEALTTINTGNGIALTISDSIGLLGIHLDCCSAVFGDTTCSAAHIFTDSSEMKVCGQVGNVCLSSGALISLQLASAGCLDITTACNTFTDANGRGLVYAADYCACFTCLSLVSANYVSGCTTNIINSLIVVTGATNGLTVCANCQVGLGGTLCTATTIDINGSSLCVYNGSFDSQCGYNISGVRALVTSQSPYSIFLGGAYSLSGCGANNLVFGQAAFYCDINGSGNVAIGADALFCSNNSSSNIGIGNAALCRVTDGYNNIALGDSTLRNNCCNNNIALGAGALFSNSTGSNNVAVGIGALQSNSTGSNNVAIGTYAGGITGNFNVSSGVFIGNCAGYFETNNDRLHIANNTGCTLICGDFVAKTVCIDADVTVITLTCSSDIRQKRNILPITIEPVNVEYKQFEHICKPSHIRYGVIAQDIQNQYPELVKTESDGMLSVHYTDLLVKEIAYLKCKVNELDEKLNSLTGK